MKDQIKHCFSVEDTSNIADGLHNATETMMESGFEEYKIPLRMRNGIRRYLLLGEDMGHFLTALFENDFQMTVARADDENRGMLREWAFFVYNYVPSGSWGSKEKVVAYANRIKLLNGQTGEDGS